MSEMVRKQIYISRRQQAMLKRLAEARGLSEAEVIRQAIDRESSHAALSPGKNSQTAWEQAHVAMLSLLESAGKFSEPYAWHRDEVYESRLGRYQIQERSPSEGSGQE